MTGAYERELREVLAGTDKGVKAVSRSCSPEEKARMYLIQRRPFLVVRAAGSGMEGSGDLVALRGDCCFPIEVKTTKADKLYFSGRTKDQLNAHSHRLKFFCDDNIAANYLGTGNKGTSSCPKSDMCVVPLANGGGKITFACGPDGWECIGKCKCAAGHVNDGAKGCKGLCVYDLMSVN